MKRRTLILLAAAGTLLSIALFGPFLVPVPPLEDAVPPQQLADPDSRFVEIGGLTVHYKLMGTGKPALILLHGFAASTFSWREVMEPLAERRTVIAFDRPAFGLTERPMPGEWRGESPYSRESQADQTILLMDALGVEQAALVGHSAGGTIAALAALRHPERVEALILVDPAIYGGGAPEPLRFLLDTPQMRHLGPLIARSIQERGEEIIKVAWHDPSGVTPEVLEGYRRPLRAENWDRALWEFTVAGQSTDLAGRLDELTLPTLVITGDDDRIVPTQQSLRLAGEMPNARLVVIPDCGHLPHEERPQIFLEAVEDFLNGLEP